MAFMSREVLESEAKRLGINLEGLTWNEQQAAVTKAQAITKTSPPSPNKGNRKNPLLQYVGKKVLIAPEMAATNIQLIKYDEELGDELKIEEQKVYLGILKEQGREHIDGTVTIKGKTGKKTVAESTLPKINVGITFDPNKDIVPVCTFNGRSGYLWSHHRLPNVKDLLRRSGYLEEYLPRFKGNDHDVYYVGGKLLCCDIGLTHAVLGEIERKHAQRKKFNEFD